MWAKAPSTLTPKKVLTSKDGMRRLECRKVQCRHLRIEMCPQEVETALATLSQNKLRKHLARERIWAPSEPAKSNSLPECPLRLTLR